MLNREIPFLRIGIPFCAGILCGYFFTPHKLFIISAGIIAVTGLALSVFYNRRFTNLLYGAALTLALFLTGLLLFLQEKSSLTTLSSEETYFSGFLADYPERKEKTYKMVVCLESAFYEGKPAPVKGSVLLYHRHNSMCKSYRPGDRITFRCKPFPIRNRGNPFEFDYRFYMENRGIKYYSFTDSSDIISFSSQVKRKLQQRALITRQRIIDMYSERGITGERLALVAAITLGQKSMLEPEQKQHFMKAGIMHIMAVSGLHAMILSMFVFRMLFFLKGRLSILRSVITILLLWWFAYVTGLTASVMRAALMFTFLQAGNIMKRPVNQVNSVLASAFILMVIRPSVIFDAGFLLSYSAVIFIIYFYRDFYLLLKFRRRMFDLVWQSAAVTIVAQAGTLPLTVLLFNRFPTWFILSNIIIVPLSSLVIIIGSLVPLTFPLRFISFPLAKLLDFLTGATEFLTAKAASLPLSTIDNIGLTVPVCILFSVTLFVWFRFLLNRKSLPVSVPLTFSLLLVIAGTVTSISTRRSSEIIIYNSTGYSPAAVRTGRNLFIYSDSAQAGPEIERHSAVLGLKTTIHMVKKLPVLLNTGDKTILLTNVINFNILSESEPDIIVLTGKMPSIARITQTVKKPEAVIVTNGNRPSAQGVWILRSLKSDTLHFIADQGAFRTKLP